MNVDALRDKKILIWGYGLEGKSILDLLIGRGIPRENITVATNSEVNEKLGGIDFILEDKILDCKFDVAVKSPGISFYRREIEILEYRGTLITSILNILLAEVQTCDLPLKTIGITGTKGKSTTASMCYHMLRSLGHRVALLGNIGVSFLDVIDSLGDYDYLLLELSSCQLQKMMYRLDYGILLNLFREHLDWHISHENYFRDKLNIIKYSKICFVNYRDQITSKYVDMGNYSNLFNSEDSYHIRDGNICYGKDRLFAINSLNNIKGEHIFTNLCALLAMLKKEKLDVGAALESLREFKTLPHRLEVFYSDSESNSKFVDDSIATIPEATIEALKTFKDDNIFLILGGLDRQQDYSEILEFIEKNKNVSKVFLIGQTGEKLVGKLKNSEFFKNLEDLIKSIKNHNLENITVLLSPAAASFDMFENFKTRGNKFKELMKTPQRNQSNS
ncbi:MAG: UDP-N-acetylmuramoyl-L-alanine--D-glutamate ligase [Rickettsiales bacterium]|jgi:UDP-N-acetylmuramoylalanine--D-glutamate ligase|nr:UDP-N-acetylmuramoyl-L-alanine--D-glutamate ligase [Rickettsiales bacterium]